MSADVSPLDQLLRAIRSIVQAEIRALVGLPGVYEYSIFASDGTTVDAIPTSAVGLPSVNKVPLRSSAIGPLNPVTGKLCHIVFVNGDPRRPVCTWCEPNSGPAVSRVGDDVNAGYLLFTSTGTYVNYFPGTPAGEIAANAAASALMPPGTVAAMTGGAITSGSAHAECE